LLNNQSTRTYSDGRIFQMSKYFDWSKIQRNSVDNHGSSNLINALFSVSLKLKLYKKFEPDSSALIKHHLWILYLPRTMYSLTLVLILDCV